MYISIVSIGCARGIREKQMFETEMKEEKWSRGEERTLEGVTHVAVAKLE